jgi:argininosuccinate lyase
MKLNRDEFRNLKSFSREQMEKWLQGYYNITYNSLRKEFEAAYKDELDSSIQNFITAIAYTLHFNEDVHLSHDELSGFMDDLFVSVDLFRKGEYNPEDYREQLREDGIEIAKYDYDRLYREKDAPYKDAYDKLVEFLKQTKSRAKVVDDMKVIMGMEVKADDKQGKASE